MTTVAFSNWSDALEAADLPQKARNRHRIIIKWFLGHLSRERRGLSVEAAGAFVDRPIEERGPEGWQVRQGGEVLNWCFREAPVRASCPSFPSLRVS